MYSPEQVAFTTTSTMTAFMQSPAYVRVLAGPVGGGKSVCCCHELIRMAQAQAPALDGIRRTRFLIVRNTADQLRSTTLKTIKDWFPPTEGFGRWAATERTLYYRFGLDDGTIVETEWMLRALDDEADVANALSLEVTAMWGNECRELHPAVLAALLKRTNRYPSLKSGGGFATRAGAVLDTNMPGMETWWEDKMSNPPKNWSVHIQPPAVLPITDWIAKYGEDPPDHLIATSPSSITYVVDPNADNVRNLAPSYYTDAVSSDKDDDIDVYLRCHFGRTMSGLPVYDQTFKPHVHIATSSLSPIRSTGYPLCIGLDHGRCYDEETEVLTRVGWKLFKDVDETTDQAATLNPVTRALEYTDINFKVATPYSGEMLCWEGTNINLCVTPEHRFPFTHRETPDILRWASAEEMSEKLSAHRYAIVAPREWHGTDITGIPCGLSQEDYAEFLGWWMSDGHVEKGTNRIVITQKKCTPDLDALMQRLHRQHGLIMRDKNGWAFSDREFADHLRAFGPKHGGNRRVPDSIMFAPRHVINLFVMAYTGGDGTIRPPRRATGCEEHVIWFQQRDLAGQFQDLGQKLGWGSAIRYSPGHLSTFKDGRTTFGCGGWYVSFKKNWERVELLPKQFSRVAYDGVIYCLNVPYHTLCVRRNGKVSWNGNTPAAIIAQMTPKGRVQILSELITESSATMGIQTFISQRLKPHLAERYPGIPCYVAPDPAGWQKSQVNERCPVDYLKDAGFKVVKPWTNKPKLRIEAVETLLTRSVDGESGLIIDPECRTLIKGFRGMYKWGINKAGELANDSEPVKNHPWSDVHDACQYCSMMIDGNQGATQRSTRREIKVARASGWT